MTHGGTGGPLGWQPQGPSPQGPYSTGDPAESPPLAVPGWPAALTVPGAILAVFGTFFLSWVGGFGFRDLDDAIAAQTSDAAATWLDVYYIGALLTIALAVTPQVLTTVRTIRATDYVVGITRKSIQAGNLGPTRVLLTLLAGAALLFQVIMVLTWVGGDHVGGLALGPWLLMLGTALCAVGVATGLRQPE
jgi:hypothetical protein